MKRLGMILLAAAGAATAADATFDAGSNVLTVPSLVVGNQRITNVQVRLKAFDLVSVGTTTTITNLPGTCTAANVNSANLAAVKALVVTDPTKVGGPLNTPQPGYQTIDIDKATAIIGCQPTSTDAPFGNYGSGSYQITWLIPDGSSRSIFITNTNTTVGVFSYGI
jgi:hypothetical protein